MSRARPGRTTHCRPPRATRRPGGTRSATARRSIRLPIACLASVAALPHSCKQSARGSEMPEPVDTVIAAAREFLGDRITTNATLREHHSHGQDAQPPVLPDAVAFVETSEEAAHLLSLCHAERVPVVAWGAGTSLEGHVTPVRGGVTLDLS